MGRRPVLTGEPRDRAAEKRRAAEKAARGRREFDPGSARVLQARRDPVHRELHQPKQALAFRRSVRDQILTFGCSSSAEAYDEQTRSIWNEMGEAVSGPFAGAQLEYLDSGIEEWYAFAAYHPNTEIFAVR